MTSDDALIDLHTHLIKTLQGLCGRVSCVLEQMSDEDAVLLSTTLVNHANALKDVMLWHKSYHDANGAIRRAK
jgi:hypothetical protein